MNTQTRQAAIIIAVIALALMTLSIVAGLLALVLMLHDGAATASVVNTLVWMGVAGVIAMASLAGVDKAITGAVLTKLGLPDGGPAAAAAPAPEDVPTPSAPAALTPTASPTSPPTSPQTSPQTSGQGW